MKWFGVEYAANLRALSEIGITVHWIILQYTIGLLTLAVIFEIIATWKNDEVRMEMAYIVSKAAVVNFAIGAATGTMSEFGLLLFWPNMLLLVGKYYFIPLYLEVFMFFTEVIFVYLYYYTWYRIGPKAHIFAGIMGALGAIFSGLLIISVNTLMSYPPGLIQSYDPSTGTWSEPRYEMVNPDGSTQVYTSSQLRNLIDTDPNKFHAILGSTVEHYGIWGIVFQSHGVVWSWLHAIFAAIIVTVMTLLSIHSYQFLKSKTEEKKTFYRRSLKDLSIIGTVALITQGLIGDAVAKNMAKYNPEKFAATEGFTQKQFTLSHIPGAELVVKFLAYSNFNAKLPNYDALPSDFKPPLIIHYLYYTKIGFASLMFLSLLIYLFFFYYKKQDPPAWFLLANAYTMLVIAQLTSNIGWITREVGRKPWTIYGILRVDEAARQTPVHWYLIVAVIAYTLILLFLQVMSFYLIFRTKKTSKEE